MRRISDYVIRELKEGSEEAFEEIYYAYKDIIFYQTISYLKNKEDTDDCVQEIFIKLYRNINQFDDTKASFDTWLLILAKNHALNFYRDNNRRKEKVILANEKIDKIQVESNIDKKLILDDIKNILEEDEYKYLVYKLGYKMSLRQIEKIEGISRETIRQKYNEAINKVDIYFNRKDHKNEK